MANLFIATPEFTHSKNPIFGKNSDREPNEGQAIIRIPAMETTEDKVQCTFISIPQVKTTYEVLISKPYQTWGCEMGVNQFGLTIGTQELHTKIKVEAKNHGLTPTDMVRLALERHQNAENALAYITELLAEYGQNTNNGYLRERAYSSAFLIADSKNAYLLETAGREWAALKVGGFRAIRGEITIEERYDMCSEKLIETARQQKWLKAGQEFSFREAYSPKAWWRTKLPAKTAHLAEQLVMDKKGLFDVTEAFKVLSAHHPKTKNFNPSKHSPKDICTHTSAASYIQTNNSMVVEIRENNFSTCWFTGTSNPCISIFKPFFIPGKNIYQGIFKEPAKLVNESLWWTAEQMNRRVAINYRNSVALFDKERSEIQQAFIQKENAFFAQKNTKKTDKALLEEELTTLSNDSLRIHMKKLLEWNFNLKKFPVRNGQFSPLYNRHIKSLEEGIIPVV